MSAQDWSECDPRSHASILHLCHRQRCVASPGPRGDGVSPACDHGTTGTTALCEKPQPAHAGGVGETATMVGKGECPKKSPCIAETV